LHDMLAGDMLCTHKVTVAYRRFPTVAHRNKLDKFLIEQIKYAAHNVYKL
jgi:hypothetical protein